MIKSELLSGSDFLLGNVEIGIRLGEILFTDKLIA